MRRQSFLVAATGASVLAIALVSAATAFVVLNHEEKARIVGGLTIDDGSADQDEDRSLILRMADALAGKLLEGWGSQTAQIAGSGTVAMAPETGAVEIASVPDMLGEILPGNGSASGDNTGFRIDNFRVGSYSGSGTATFGGPGFPSRPGYGMGGGAPDGERLVLPAPAPLAAPPTPLDVVLPPQGDTPPNDGPFTPTLPPTVGETPAAAVVIAQVPEPGTLAMLGGGLSMLALGLGWRRRRARD